VAAHVAVSLDLLETEGRAARTERRTPLVYLRPVSNLAHASLTVEEQRGPERAGIALEAELWRRAG